MERDAFILTCFGLISAKQTCNPWVHCKSNRQVMVNDINIILTPASVQPNQVGVVWVSTLCYAELPAILVLQVQHFTRSALKGQLEHRKGLATMTLLVDKKMLLDSFYFHELCMEVIHQSTETNSIWCAWFRTLPSPSILHGLHPHKTLKKSDLKNNLISQPKLITHGLQPVDALKPREWGISFCCCRWFFFCDHMQMNTILSSI